MSASSFFLISSTVCLTASIGSLKDNSQVGAHSRADFGYTRKEVLAENDIEFNSLEEMETKHEELNLGDIMSDAYVYAVENSEYYDGDPVDVAVVPSGTVRDTYTKGDITVEDVYNSFSCITKICQIIRIHFIH